MKRSAFVVVLLLLLSIVSGYLLSKASLAGRVGISVFYKEYRFLKVWWQGALVVFLVWLLLFAVQGLVQRRASRNMARLLHAGCIATALVGLYFTYNDFRHSFNHRLLGERFHLGAYLFWLGWMVISLFYLAFKQQHNPTAAATAVR